MKTTTKNELKNSPKVPKAKEYTVLIGFDLPNGKRYDKGSVAKDLTPHEVKVLTEAKAIEAK